MLVTALAQTRFATALITGRPIPAWALDRLIAAARDTQREFGAIGAEGADAVTGPALDPETRRAMQLRRFRTQAQRAARETAYYGRLFAALGLDPGTLEWDDIDRLPPTPKEALRTDPDAFVRRSAQPALRTTTTGTTGQPTRVAFSQAELRTMMGLSALGFLLNGQLAPDDVVLMATSSRATLGNLGLAGACAHIGALLQPVGLIEPALTLSLLTENLRIAGKKPRVSVVSTYPSYLGELVECGLSGGYGPADFGLERITVGGEVVTDGLRARARRLFGEGIHVESGYAMTETLPFGGTLCDQGHLHFEPAHGLLEVLDPETGAACAPGEAGTLVLSPFPPFRETTLLLRYDTHDVVRPLAGPFTCRLRHLPATTDLLGKLRLSIRHDGGWTYPRQVLEALEAVEFVPLPARCGCWAVPDGVAVEVVVRNDNPAARRAIERSLEEQGVPVGELHLLEDSTQLQRPFPLRTDLRELSFDVGAANPPRVAIVAGQGG
ncbi:MAG: phenylacetate--CoA ligase family protein [Thermomicrobiales bacterium]